MLIKDTSTPVVVLSCKLGGLAIMRSMGLMGVATHGIDGDAHSPGMTSRYCRRKFYGELIEAHPEKLLALLHDVHRQIGQPAILIPTSDETAVFVAEYQDDLGDRFLFPRNPAQLIKDLMSKKAMYHLARQHNIPTPLTKFPQNLGDVEEYLAEARFPVMLKAIFGNRLQQRTGKKMVSVSSPEELISQYKLLEDPDDPNLMLQECIPGGDDQVYIFNGYFDADSQCLSPFTGHKIR